MTVDYIGRLFLDLHSRKISCKKVGGRKVIFDDNLYKNTDIFGTVIPIYEELVLLISDKTIEPEGDPKDYVIVLDSIFKGAPKGVLRAAVKHEDVHTKHLFLKDNSRIGEKSADMKLTVNTLAFMESRNPFCMTLQEITKELREYLKETK